MIAKTNDMLLGLKTAQTNVINVLVIRKTFKQEAFISNIQGIDWDLEELLRFVNCRQENFIFGRTVEPFFYETEKLGLL